MAKISVDLDEQSTNQFRNLAKVKFSKKKNFLALALKEAIDKWISEYKAPNRTICDFNDSNGYNRKPLESQIDSPLVVLESKEPSLNILQNKNGHLFYTSGYQKNL